MADANFPNFYKVLNEAISPLVTGVDAAQLVNWYNAYEVPLRKRMTLIAITAAITQRRALEDTIGALIRNDASVVAEINAHFLLNGRIKFSSLALLGHMLISRNECARIAIVSAWIRKAGGNSLFNYNLSNFSDKRRQVIADVRDKVGQLTYEDQAARLNVPAFHDDDGRLI